MQENGSGSDTDPKFDVSFPEMYSTIDNWWGQIDAYLPLFIPASWLAIEITVLSILLTWVCGLVAARRPSEC